LTKRLQHIIVLLMLLGSFKNGIAQIAMPDTVCIGVSRTYQVNDAVTPSTYTWRIDGVTQTSTANKINITWNSTGVFVLTVQEHPASGCDGDIRSGLVYVNTAPVANAGRDTTICFGKTVRLDGSGGPPYEWTPAGNLSGQNIANPIVSLTAAGEYKYALSINNANGCSSPADTVVITMLPPAKVYAGNDTLIGSNQPLQLNAVDVNNTGFINYTWSPSFALNDWQIKNPSLVTSNDFTYSVTASTINGRQLMQ
jgi:hypothetical protein